MSSVDEFSDMFVHSVQIAEPLGTNAYGELSYNVNVPYKARITGVVKTVTDINGREKVAMYKVFLKTNKLIDPTSKITLPSGYTPQQPKILSIGSFPDEIGNHHTVLFLG